MDRNQPSKFIDLPALTNEEKEILFQTRREALVKRVIPLMLASNLFVYVNFRRIKTSIAVKCFAYGGMSFASVFCGVASYGSEFRRRIDALEDSPLRDALIERSNEGKTFPMSQRTNPPGFPQAPDTSPFVNPRDKYTNFQTNDLRNTPGGQMGSGKFSSQASYNSFNANDGYDNRFDTFDSRSPYSDAHLNQDRDPSPYNFAYEERTQSSTPESVSPDNQRYMSYKERRAFYRNNPGMKGEVDPFSNANSKPNNPTYLNPHATPSYPKDIYPNQTQGTVERPFIPFFNEGSYTESNDNYNERKNF